MTDSPRQPWLHRLILSVDGPVTVVSDAAGGLDAPGAGVLADDRRVVSRLDLRLGGRSPEPLAASAVGASSEHWLSAPHLGDDGPDPTVEVLRERTVDGDGVHEVITLRSRATRTIRTELELFLAGDGADLAQVKRGTAAGTALPVRVIRGAGTPEWGQDAGPDAGQGGAQDAAQDPAQDVGEDAAQDAVAARFGWGDERHHVVVTLDPHPQQATRDGEGLRLRWALEVAPAATWRLRLRIGVLRLAGTAFDAGPGSGLADWDPEVIAGSVADPTLAQTVRTGLTDLRHLLLTDPDGPDAPDGRRDLVAAAGTPWYLTLFGRDALWTARMMLPLSPSLARGTLRALARRQADHDDEDSGAEVGKILHEVRRTTYASGTMRLPTVYFGTVDATPLWVTLLVESWRAGLPDADVAALRPTLDGALSWMRGAAERSPDGLLRYVDGTGHGLSNQGWKDSGDSMRRADGSIAPAPIALVEAQAYAVQAARGAADLLDAVDGSGGAPWRAWADALSDLVRERFWVGPDHDRYLAMALDAQGRTVDGVGSNMGHVLGTGVLSAPEAALVVRRLMRPDLLREFGIGTLSSDNPAYNPIGYHTGSVWTHDTAAAMLGMAAEGYPDEAREVATRLLRLSAGTGYRLPELVGGESVLGVPVPYPAACRPQAWAAASAAALLQVLTG